jgi:excisionase family DNA binding protein
VRPAQRLYTVEHAAASLGISAQTLYRQIREGRVAHTKLGRRIGLSDAQIDAIAKSGERNPVRSPRPSRRRTNL